MRQINAIELSQMRIIRRQRGGYLALSICSPRIGVTADTEDEAKEKLNYTFARWMEILDGLDEPACEGGGK